MKLSLKENINGEYTHIGFFTTQKEAVDWLYANLEERKLPDFEILSQERNTAEHPYSWGRVRVSWTDGMWKVIRHYIFDERTARELNDRDR